MIQSKNIRVVIDNFKKVLPLAMSKKNLDMDNIFIKCVNFGAEHTCGTVHCHGGWYGVAVCDTSESGNIFFDAGAEIMAIHLGFKGYFNESRIDLIEWAENNPLIWGNSFGAMMFSEKEAFYNKTKRPAGAKRLQHIIDHWEEVYVRVKTAELLSTPPVNDLINNAIKTQQHATAQI